MTTTGGCRSHSSAARWPSACAPPAAAWRSWRTAWGDSSPPARQRLAGRDERFINIVGVGQETVTAVVRRDDDFLYTLTRHGDGTVPAASAVLAGVRSAYARVAHSNLTRDPLVAAAVVEVLRRGATARPPRTWLKGAPARTPASARATRPAPTPKPDLAAPPPPGRRPFL